MICQPPTGDILQRVFCITVNRIRGSAFAVPVGAQICLVTAKHLVADLPVGRTSQIGIFTGLKTENVEITPHLSDAADVDIAILETTIAGDPNAHPGLELTSDNVIFGQDTYFLGFPYFDKQIKYQSQRLNNGFPFPLVKKATYSGFSEEIHYLDGHNNPGFSGGPVILTVQNPLKQVIWGVVSGYVSHLGKVAHIQTAHELAYQENSGIIVISSIRHAVQLIQSVYGRLPNANLGR